MRPCKLKLNEKQKRLVLLNEFIFNEQNLLLQHWKFFNKLRMDYLLRWVRQVTVIDANYIYNFFKVYP